VSNKCEKKHAEEGTGGEHNTETGSHAESLKGTVGDAETDEVPMRAGSEYEVNVRRDRLEVLRGCRGRDGFQDLLAHHIGYVELFWRALDKEEVGYNGEFLVVILRSWSRHAEGTR